MLEKEYGFDFLEEAGVFNYLAQIAGNPDGDDIELVLMKCGVWKFFGRHSVCNVKSELEGFETSHM